MSTVVQLHTRRPRTFTANEQVIDRLRELIFESHIPYSELAVSCGLSKTTIERLARGDTKWPRPTTLFPLLQVLGYGMQLVKIK